MIRRSVGEEDPGYLSGKAVALFERFLAAYTPTRVDADAEARGVPKGLSVPGFDELGIRFAGCTFNHGLYRLHSAMSGDVADRWVADAFPEFAARAWCFGFDWLGRQFVLDCEQPGSEGCVLMLEPGTGHVLTIPATFSTFHENELVEASDAAVASEFFTAWAARNATSLPLAPTTCVGYKVPLFLGGSDTLDNLELVDLDVYWTVCGQLRRGSIQLRPGTTVGEVRIGGE